jgi:hypothetical protein
MVQCVTSSMLISPLAGKTDDSGLTELITTNMTFTHHVTLDDQLLQLRIDGSGNTITCDTLTDRSDHGHLSYHWQVQTIAPLLIQIQESYSSSPLPLANQRQIPSAGTWIDRQSPLAVVPELLRHHYVPVRPNQ